MGLGHLFANYKSTKIESNTSTARQIRPYAASFALPQETIKGSHRLQ